MCVNKQEFEKRAMAAAQKLHRIALTMLPCEADCEDAVQEALVRAWMNIGKLREPQYFDTWLCRILINECKRILRKRKMYLTAELPDSLPEAQPESPELWEALKRVDAAYRLPLMLHHVEGHAIAQCAQMLSLPQSTVKWRIHQGKQKLAAFLREGEE